jgi:hypothetical protein
MDDFLGIAARIAEEGSQGGFDPGVIIAQGLGHGDFNLYPGTPGTACHHLAMFLSLKGSLRPGKRYLSFEEALIAIITHMSPRKCGNITDHVVLFTDEWWAPAFEKFSANLRDIADTPKRIDIYLISPGKVLGKIVI